MKVLDMRMLLLCSVLTFCSTPKVHSETEWLQRNVTDIGRHIGYDFSVLKKDLKDAKIVALGESSHGIGEFYDLKSELVHFLHEDMDFNVLAFEAGVGHVNLGWMDREK